MIDWSECPESGRRSTLVEALQALDGEAASIVEIGTSRNPDHAAMISDGWATRVFAWYVATAGGALTTIDIRRSAIEAAERICRPWGDDVAFIEADALDLAPELVKGVDLLYMDGPPDAEFHRRVWQALGTRPSLVLFDDILDDSFRVKGETVIPEMLDDGYELVFRRDRQALLRRKP